MAIDSDLASLLGNLNGGGGGHYLPPKPWESIATESGRIDECSTSTSSHPIYDPFTLSESNLVKLIINALQGVKSALHNIDNICEAFFSDPADRSFHRIPSLWHRSSSTNGFGKILKSVGHSGHVFLLLCKFVEYFLGANLNVGVENSDGCKTREKETSPIFAESHAETQNGDSQHENEKEECPRYSLVNQAFSVAVGKVLEGYLCALNTLSSSIKLRHSNAAAVQQVSPGVDCLSSVVHPEMSVLEVYLHTKELRTHIQALQNICFFKNEDLSFLKSSREDFTAETILKHRNFPIGADLLTYLYVQLRDADPVHHALLKFLFVRSCEPYSGFIKSWIYQALICDPYKEFIIEYEDETAPRLPGKAGQPSNFSLPSIKERDGVAVPCFLQDVHLPLLRAGQQLQVLVKLLNMCRFSTMEDHSYRIGADFSSHLSNLEDILPYWNDSSSNPASCLCPLTFSKRNIEAMILKRETVYRRAQEKLRTLLPRLSIRCRHISSSVNPYFTVPFSPDNRRDSAKALISNERLIVSPSISDKEATDLAAGGEDTDASSTSDDCSSDIGQSHSFGCPSLNIFEEKNKFNGYTGLPDAVVAETVSASGFFANQSILKKPLASLRLQEFVPEISCDRMDTKNGMIDAHNIDMELTQLHDTLHASRWCRKSQNSGANYLFEECWPSDSLLKNPFSFDRGYEGDTHVFISNGSQKVIDSNMEISKREDSQFVQKILFDDSNLELCMQKDELRKTRKYEDSSQSWNLHKNKLLSMNPMLTKNTWFHTRHDSRDANWEASENSSFPHFDFSSVEDPYKAYKERFNANLNHGYQVDCPAPTVSVVSVLDKVNDDNGEQCQGDDDNPFDQEKDLFTNTSGGAKWESLLSYSSKDGVVGAGGSGRNEVAGFEMPLDVIIDKCIMQEILIQYKYVSSFTIMLLEEGFDLRGHLSALRRYHFMELADWADSFIFSLWHHKWHVAEADQRVSEVQAFLDLALQRSSCESDQYKERLFISTKGQGMALLPTTARGVHSFDFISLGYRVDWPVSIVLTPNALKLYSDIFSFLTQVKLAVFSLTDIWRSFKDLLSHDSGPDEHEYYSLLTKMRQQVNHFVLTLQQYVQSQLSHVSWCRLLHSLKHQVKDVLDLESVHMTYLANSLHICFLSVETQPVASIIQKILQCALDYRSCFSGGGLKIVSSGEDTSKLLDHINFSQVLAIKATFEKNLKELYLCYLKSPKHSEFGFCRFWEYLNYNNYFSNAISKEMGWGPQ